jgi:hypothetical protein
MFFMAFFIKKPPVSLMLHEGSSQGITRNGLYLNPLKHPDLLIKHGHTFYGSMVAESKRPRAEFRLQRDPNESN